MFGGSLRLGRMMIAIVDGIAGVPVTAVADFASVEHA
jgi:hypothetical protein